MNPRTLKIMCKINAKLEKYQSIIRLIEMHAGRLLILNTGQQLVNKEAERFVRRILGNTIDWTKNAELWLNNPIEEQKIKSNIAALAGISCQIKHRDKIRKNLNNGIPWNKNLKGLPGHPCSEESKKKISLKNSGVNNGMYGTKMSNEQKLQQSNRMKKLILDGKFTPNSNNRNTHWNAIFDGKKFRSSWEALFQCLTPTAKYETLRIEYFDSISIQNRIYIVDFIDHASKTVIEIKPKELSVGSNFIDKQTALQKWTIENGYQILLVDIDWFKHNKTIIDYTKFDSKTANKIRKIFNETY